MSKVSKSKSASKKSDAQGQASSPAPAASNASAAVELDASMDSGEQTPTLDAAARAPVSTEMGRLHERMSNLAQRKAWGGVERHYQEMLALGEPIQGDAHYWAAQGSLVRADIDQYQARLRLAAAGGADIGADLENSEEAYERVSISRGKRALGFLGRGGPELEVDVNFFRPDHRKAFERARATLKAEGSFEGLLPVGSTYTVKGERFTLEKGESVSITYGGRSKSAKGSAAEPAEAVEQTDTPLIEAEDYERQALDEEVLSSPNDVSGEVLSQRERLRARLQREEWRGANTAYGAMLALGEPLSGEDHAFGAQAALNLGDLGAAIRRYELAKKGGADVGDDLAALTARFGDVVISPKRSLFKRRVEGGPSIEPTTAPFARDSINAIEVARRSLAETGSFEGVLPIEAGPYRVAGHLLEVREGGRTTFAYDPASVGD
ncbi:MAG: hypothetical protein EA397_04140 [Deltaproteobacteria bacterium]|nr:MAG: hypothetical protein EA397_04140 [Deltaproteobacteria bacterium]